MKCIRIPDKILNSRIYLIKVDFLIRLLERLCIYLGDSDVRTACRVFLIDGYNDAHQK